MDHQYDLLRLCKPIFVKLTRLSDSTIDKWVKPVNRITNSRFRRRAENIYEVRNRLLEAVNNHELRKRALRSRLSDSDDDIVELDEDDSDNAVLNEYTRINEDGIRITRAHIKSNNSSTAIPKKNSPTYDKSVWKYKQKRRKTSQSSGGFIKNDENIGISTRLELNNLNQSNSHETMELDLSKEIKIISSRLEDSNDPQVEIWRSKKVASPSMKGKFRLSSKSNNMECAICSVEFESEELLSNHIFKHTQQELKDAYIAVKNKFREESVSNDIDKSRDEINKRDLIPQKQHQSTTPRVIVFNDKSETVSHLCINPLKEVSQLINICSCHAEHHPENESIQIEMVLFCESCNVIFRRNECFELHYRSNARCSANRTKGRHPKLFCSTCRILLDTLSNMRRHLQKHASVNFHGTVTFVCNICRVVFFGVGTVFCTHWFNHEKDPMFIASRYSFPKLYVSSQGAKPIGSSADEQYVFIAEYVCRICKQQFSSESELANHSNKDCKSVLMQMTDQKKQQQIDTVHLKMIDSVNKWICEFCNECCPSFDMFEKHSFNHLQDDEYPGYSCVFQLNSPKAFICNICREVTDSLCELMKHWITHDAIKFVCTVCDAKSLSYISFETHISIRCWKFKPNCRILISRRQHVCKVCKATYKSAEELAHHYSSQHHMEAKIDDIEIGSLQRVPFQSPPTSETSASPKTKENNLNKNFIANSLQSVVTDSTLKNVSVTAGSPDNSVIIDTTVLPVESSACEKSNIETSTIPDIVIESSNLNQNSSITALSNLIVNSYYDKTFPKVPTKDTLQGMNLTRSVISDSTKDTEAEKQRRNSDSQHEIEQVSLNLQALFRMNSSSNASSKNISKLNNQNLALKKCGRTDKQKETDDVILENSRKKEGNEEVDIIEKSSDLTIAKPSKALDNVVRDNGLEEQKNNQMSSINCQTNQEIIISSESEDDPKIIHVVDKVNENSQNNDVSKPRGFLRVKKFTELQAVKNYFCNLCTAAFDNVNSLNEHIVAHNRCLMGNSQHPTMMAALILPQADASGEQKEINSTKKSQNTSQAAEIAMLSNIPTPVANINARQISHTEPVPIENINAIGISPTLNSSTVPNVHDFIQGLNFTYYTCPICLIFRCQRVEDFTNHLTTTHSNANPLMHSHLSISNNPSPDNEVSKEKQKIFSCKICKYTTLNKKSIVEHVRTYHLSRNGPILNTGHRSIIEPPLFNNLNIPVNGGVSSNSGSIYTCNLCSTFQYHSLDELKHHLQTVHQFFSQKNTCYPYICNFCFCLFRTYDELIIHTNNHHNTNWA